MTIQCKRTMTTDRRIEARILCADLVDIQWRDPNNRSCRAVANLEDISLSGACLQVERPVPLESAIRITYPNGELPGRVKYCIFREIGYFLGIEFNLGTRWSKQSYPPQYILDPRTLVVKRGVCLPTHVTIPKLDPLRRVRPPGHDDATAIVPKFLHPKQ
jgi:hypothetical protein